MADLAKRWAEALTFDQFLETSTEHRGLWEGIYRTARVPAWAVDAVSAGTTRRLLAIVEDWCGDASNTVPVLARFAATPGIELRLVQRDRHPELMDRYLTNGSRSIPIVIVLDEAYRELGAWGPRPAALQEWVLANRGAIPKAELYPRIRRWYARDRGESTLREILEIAGLVERRAA